MVGGDDGRLMVPFAGELGRRFQGESWEYCHKESGILCIWRSVRCWDMILGWPLQIFVRS